ncbi:hypothetical protein HaLaN_03343 [Haematococcus lacustris]|uniref:Uncharacterized protein n=1 Tax=Haematococcus lacustris TaxID=44745 RepID=A0A699YZ44_HAELA|nr:hypothetical protein HaLaN_03343 [Haematococcus lacustris]
MKAQGVSRYEPSGAMPPRKRPSAAEQEPLPIRSPQKQGPSTPPGKQREERRAEWKTQRRQMPRQPTRSGGHIAFLQQAEVCSQGCEG